MKIEFGNMPVGVDFADKTIVVGGVKVALTDLQMRKLKEIVAA